MPRGMKRKGSRIKLAGLSLLSVLATIAFTIAVDRLGGLVLQGNSGFVFAPHSVVTYSTSEFQFEARINELGFRGEAVSEKRRRYRIVALGDSYTYGWGVNTGDTWPKRVEENLRQQGLDAEVFNLGQPNIHPKQYSEIAQRAIPVLKPDLILVALNQGEDLAQTMLESSAALSYRILSSVKSGIKATYPTILSFRRRPGSTAEVMGATVAWKDQAQEFVESLGPEERRRFDRLDDDIRTMFLKGDLNPALVPLAFRYSNAMANTLQLDEPAVRQSIQQIGFYLRKIKTSAEEYGGKLIAVSLPNGFFVSRKQMETYARIGFVVNPANITTSAMDEALNSAAEQAGIYLLKVTEQFREASERQTLFFEFDGHYTPEGQRLFAESITASVASQLAGSGPR